MGSRRVLIFTYYWPPAGGPGVQRFLKFAKYLGEYGWEPVVVTPKDGSYPYLDPSLLDDVPEGLRVVKTGTREPFAIYNRLRGKEGKSVTVGMIGYRDKQSVFQRLAKYVRANFFVPDARVGWKPYAVKAGLEVIAGEEIDAIITTGPPHSTHLVGLEIQRKTGLPWLADFRDPWTTIYYNKFFPRSERTKRRDAALETQVLNNADQSVVISHGLEREFGDRAENLEVIYNGYDKEDLYDGPLKPLDAFRLSYVGNFKPNQHVPAIWEVLAEQAKSDPEFGTNLRIRFTGIVDPTVIGYLESLGLKDAVEIEDFVPHLEATRRMVEAGMLLFVIPQSENNRVIITGKIFEYLASNTVLLPVGPLDGDAARILSEADLPPMLDYSDREGMRTRIREAYAAWKTGGRMPVKRTEGDYTRFSRRELTRRLAGLLDRMVERRSAASTQASTKASSKASTKPSTR